MWFSNVVDWLDNATKGNGILLAAAILGGVLLLVAVLVSCLCKKQAVYTGVGLLLVGGLEWVIFAADTQARAAAFFRAVAWLTVGALWLLTAAIVALAERLARRKRRLILNAKNNSDLLPEKGNSYVRARLHTALHAEKETEPVRKAVPYENRGSVRLGHARRLLAGVQDAPLSQAERLETERMARSFTEYALCESWSAEQLRAVNELFARLLKLAAKYSVEG